MEEKIKKQEKALAEAEEGAVVDCHRDMLEPVRAINALTAAVLLVARILDRWSTETSSRSGLEIDRRAR